MNRYINYLKTVFWHRWWVFIYCRQFGVTGLGLIHDLSKFSPYELKGYARHFFRIDGSKIQQKPEFLLPGSRFNYAWLHHIHHNPHHWEYWVSYTKGAPDPQPMPEKYVREMIADWKAAGKVYNGQEDAFNWYQKNKANMFLHKTTSALILQLLLPNLAEPLRTVAVLATQVDPPLKVVAVLAGNYAQYAEYAVANANSHTEYLYVADDGGFWRARRLDSYVIVGSFWKKADAIVLREVVRRQVEVDTHEIPSN